MATVRRLLYNSRLTGACGVSFSSNMAAAKKWKRVAAAQDGFLTVNASKNPTDLYSSRRKRVNKNKKKSWLKHSDVQDVEQFLDDVRLQERAIG